MIVLLKCAPTQMLIYGYVHVLSCKDLGIQIINKHAAEISQPAASYAANVLIFVIPKLYICMYVHMHQPVRLQTYWMTSQPEHHAEYHIYTSMHI
jgi:hypothetical protein